MVLAGDIEIEDNILASGGFADVRMGEYAGHPVSVKRLRGTLEDDVQKIREVSVNDACPDNQCAAERPLP